MLWALLEVGQATGDEHLKDFARFGYERARDLGIPRIGCFAWTTEACAASDMVALAVKLSQYGVGDYWDDVEAYIRNQMIEHQLTDRDLIEQEVVGRGPKWEPDPPQVISDRLVDRAIGSFARTPCPTRVYTAWTVCCPGQRVPGPVLCLGGHPRAPRWQRAGEHAAKPGVALAGREQLPAL